MFSKIYNSSSLTLVKKIIFTSTIISSSLLFATEAKVEESPSAKIKRDSYGVPHIIGNSLESLSFGLGYAYAQDNLCLLAEQVVRFRSERARYFGKTATEAERKKYQESDFGFLAIRLRKNAQSALKANKISKDSRELISGYVKGYNKFRAEVKSGKAKAWCKDEDFLVAMQDVDLLSIVSAIAHLKSGYWYGEAMANAQPPQTKELQTNNIQKNMEKLQKYLAVKVKLSGNKTGSNGWALGRDYTENKRGLLMGNPHLAHNGILRFYEMHLLWPGRINVSGANLLGLPIVGIGFNQNIAWTHTVSSKSEQFLVYKLELSETNPLQYKYKNANGKTEYRPITSRIVSIQSATKTGIKKVSRKIYDSHFGPMISIPGKLDWTKKYAYSFKDANTNNFDSIDHWLAINKAQNLREFQDSFRKYRGITTLNTLYSDDQGNAFFIDGSPVPLLNTAGVHYIKNNTDSIKMKQEMGFYFIPGNSHIYEWQGKTGLTSFAQMPKMLNSSYVSNSNDTYWLTNADTPMKEHYYLYGKYGQQQSLRSRVGIMILRDSHGGNDKYSSQELGDAFFSNRSFYGERLVDALIGRCDSSLGFVELQENDSIKIMDISKACAAIKLWDKKLDLHSRSVALIREFANQLDLEKHWGSKFLISDF